MNLNNLTIFNLASEKFRQLGEFTEKLGRNPDVPNSPTEILISLSKHDIQIYDFHSRELGCSDEFPRKTLKGRRSALGATRNSL